MRSRLLFSLVLAFVSIPGFATLAQGQPAAATMPSAKVEIREWTVPWENTRPRDPDVDALGQVWFVGQVGNYIGKLDPKTGAFARYELPTNALPHNIIVGPTGDLWYAGNGDAHIGRIDPKTGKVIRRYPTPTPAAKDPHTLMFVGDDLWFTSQAGNSIGRLDPKSGKVQLITPSQDGARPYGIVAGPRNTPWIALFGTNRLASVDSKSMKLREYELPSKDARPRRLALTSDGRVWYVDYTRGELGVLDPKTGQVEVWSAPGGKESQPYAMAVDDKDRLWFVNTGTEPKTLHSFSPLEKKFGHATPIRSGGGSVRHMIFHKPTRTLWFGTDANTIGHASVP